MQQQISESSTKLQVALVAVSTQSVLRALKSGAKQHHWLMNSSGELVGVIKHRGRQHQWHKEELLEQEDCRTAGSTLTVLVASCALDRTLRDGSEELRSDLN